MMNKLTRSISISRKIYEERLRNVPAEYMELKKAEYDFGWINRHIKSFSYKKIEWNKINHDRYKIIGDKHRKE